MNDDVMHVLVYIVNIILVPCLIYLFKIISEFQKEKNLETNRRESESSLQRENYFREISGEEIQKLFSDWMEAISNLDSFGQRGVAHFKSIQTKAMMYGSDRTVKILALLMQQLYSNDIKDKEIDDKEIDDKEIDDKEIDDKEIDDKEIDDKEIDDKETLNKGQLKSILYMSYLVASLKEDFSGYKINPIDLLKIRLKDFSSSNMETRVEEINEEIKKEINSK